MRRYNEVPANAALVVVKSDWGSRTYTSGGLKLNKENCQYAKVVFPDGLRTTCDISWEERSQSVSDHGKDYWVTSSVPFVRIKHAGLRLKIPLKGLYVQSFTSVH